MKKKLLGLLKYVHVRFNVQTAYNMSFLSSTLKSLVVINMTGDKVFDCKHIVQTKYPNDIREFEPQHGQVTFVEIDHEINVSFGSQCFL